ncbi:HNH endonuclease [Roseovarius sp.]
MAWESGSAHSRGYGAAWRKLRLRIMRRDMWLCQPCQRNGLITPATECDHIKPKANGGDDDPANLQAICSACHADKTQAEAKEAQQELCNQGKAFVGADGWPVEPKKWGYSIPHGLQPASCRVVLVFGRPASGKSTYVAENAAKSDKVIDLDEIKVRLGGKKWGDDISILRRALRWRDMAIRGLSRQAQTVRAWLILTGQTPDERAAWMDAIGPMASQIVIDTPVDVCIERIRAEPERAAVAEKMIEAARAWQP